MVIHRLITSVVLATLLSLSSLAQAAISAQLSKTTVELGNSVQLVIDVTNADGGDTDLSPLEQHFRIAGRSEQSSNTYRNGQWQRSRKLVLTLIPLKQGQIRVEQFTVSGEIAGPIELNVRKAVLSAEDAKAVQLQSSLSTDSAWVQQPIVYTLKLTITQPLLKANLLPPQIESGEGLIEPMGDQEERRYQRDGNTVAEISQRYLITPQRSGELVISAAQLQAQVPSGAVRQTPFGRRYSGARNINLATNVHRITITPVPAQFTGKQWLVASKLELIDNWSSEQIEEGDAVTRTITINGQGIRAHQIPDVVIDSPASVRQYPEQPARDEFVQNNQIAAQLKQQITLIPTESGVLKFPAIELPWWNSETESYEVARIPESVLAVTAPAGKKTGSTPKAQPQQVVPAPAVETDDKTDLATESQADQPLAAAVQSDTATNAPAKDNVLVWGMVLLAIAGAAGVLVTLKKVRRRNTNEDVSMATRDNVQAIEKVFVAACQNNDAKDARQQLYLWCQAQWPEKPQPIAQLKQHLTAESELLTELKQLDKLLYGGGDMSWQGSKLLASFKREAAMISVTNKAQTASSALTPLNPL